MRLTTALGLALLVACNGLEYLTGPGDPVLLTPESLEGSWVHVRTVFSTSTDPILTETKEIPENGAIYEFTKSGSVTYSCRCPGFDTAPTLQYISYSISDDTLRLHQSEGAPHAHLAEVTTRRLVLTTPWSTFPRDVNHDGAPEDVTVAYIYQRMKD